MNDNVNFTISKPQNTIESGWSAESRQSQLQFVIHPKVPLFGKEGLGEIFTTICLFNDGLLLRSRPHRLDPHLHGPCIKSPMLQF